MKYVFLLLLFSGCATIETNEARNPYESMIGSNVVDLIHCAGVPDKLLKTVDQNNLSDRLELQWNYSNNDTAFDLTVSLLGSLKIGGAGQCKMTATIGRYGGTVFDVAFPQKHLDGLAPDTQACGALISECLNHPNSTQLPKDYDAFILIDKQK